MKNLLCICVLMCFTLMGYAQKKVKPDTTVYNSVEINPTFPGGEEAFGKYLRDSLRQDMFLEADGNITSRVFLKFIVEKDGSLSHIEALKGGPKARKEMISLLKTMPKWVPAQLNGKVVRNLIQVPINCIMFSE